jgi:hypothetical protein
MLIAQLSDPHFVPKDVRLFGKLDTAGYLEGRSRISMRSRPTSC